ncbi:MAG: DUF6159 family protein [Acidimicrobiales bacterium]|jgi:hypothetical protein|nr:DUF6159 family protein [Acidimicrobiales bacterium]
MTSVQPTGGNLVRAAWWALRQDRELLLLPVYGAMVALGSLVSILAAFVLVPDDALLVYVVLAVAATYLVAAVSTFFSVALAAGAHERMNGGDPTISSAMAAAWRHKRAVLGWAALSATVGLVLQSVEARFKGAGAVLGFLGGVAWAVASFFAIPIIAAQDVGPITALKTSADTFRRRWSNAVRVQLRLGLYVLGLVLATVLGLALGIVLLDTFALLGVLVILVVAAAALVGGLVLGAVSAYCRVVLYRYAVGLATPGFSAGVLEAAVVRKG